MTQMAAKKGHTLAILATLDDHMMALTTLSTARSRIWMSCSPGARTGAPSQCAPIIKKTANAYLPATPEKIGVVIMPHGANQVWNDAIERMVAPLKPPMAFGDGRSRVIQNAVERLEARNIRRIVFVRMHALARHLKDRRGSCLPVSPAAARSAGMAAMRARRRLPHRCEAPRCLPPSAAMRSQSNVKRPACTNVFWR